MQINVDKFGWGPGEVEVNNGPRSLSSEAVRQGRLSHLYGSDHMHPLIRYTQSLREDARGFVPDFDPFDGGTEAEILFLLEKPGPKAAEPPNGSGFISRDNDDPTAEAILNFMELAGIPRRATVLWNLIPWWNGAIAYGMEERREGLLRLPELLDLLPKLRSVVAVGKQAERARPVCETRGLTFFASIHPSGRNKNLRRSKWKAIPEIWAKAWCQHD